MALSGTISKSYAGGNVVLRIAWTATQDAAANTSTLTATAYLDLSSSQYIPERYNNTIRVDGEETKFLHSAGTASSFPLKSITKTVSHDVSGDRSVALYCEFRMQKELYGYSMNNLTVSGTAELDGIAKASTISAITGTVEVDGTSTVTVTIARKVSGVYHKVKFFLDDARQYTTDMVETGATWAIPTSWLDGMPNSTSATATATLTTYKDAACTIFAAGDADVKSFEVTVPADVCPAVSEGWATLAPYNQGTAVPENWNEYVQGYSRCEVTFDSSKIDMSGCHGATVTSYRVVADGVTAAQSPYRTQVLNTAGNRMLTCYVNDSRGRFTAQNFWYAVRPYAQPTMTGVSAYRCGSTGTAAGDGTCISFCASLEISSVNEKNAGTLTASWMPRDGSWNAGTALTSGTASVLGDGNVLITKTYVARITVTDSLGNQNSVDTVIPTENVGFHIRSGNTGAGIGKYGETDGVLEVAFSQIVNGSLSVTGDATVGGAMELGSPLAVAQGGTGATDAAGARGNLGALSNAGGTATGALYGTGAIGVTSTGWPTVRFSVGSVKKAEMFPNLSGESGVGDFRIRQYNADASYYRDTVLDSFTGSANQSRDFLHTQNLAKVNGSWTYVTPTNGTTPASLGNGALRYRVVGTHVYLTGGINITWGGESLAFATLGVAPSSSNHYWFAPCSGGNVARMYVGTDGILRLEWVKALSDGSNVTTFSAWVDCQTEFWTD